jgi:dihydrofolate reductase/thymidylate synthase
MKPFSIVVAMDARYGIGKNGRLPWHLPSDLKHFKTITTETQHADKRNAVIMGRRTWESLPPGYKPLPQRINVVLTQQENYALPMQVYKAASLNQSLELAVTQLKYLVEDIFVIGGGKVYEEAILHPFCRKIYVTHIVETFGCDTFFPKELSKYRRTVQSEPRKEGGVSYFFAEYIRI